MANLRVLIARALTGADLTDSPYYETALDRIIAFAFADALGQALWRLKYAQEREVWPRAVYILARRAREVTPEDNLRWELCGLVVDEWLDDACDVCDGRKFLLATSAEAMRVCPKCLGTGVKRHSDQSRMRRLKFDDRAYNRWQTRIATLHQRVANADFRVWREVAHQLGWLDWETVERQVLAKPRPPAMLRVVPRSDPAQKNITMPDPVVSTASGWQ